MKNKFEQYKNEMIELILQKYKTEGSIQSQIPKLDFHVASEISQSLNIIYEPSICIVLQGEKSVEFGDTFFQYSDDMYLVASTHLPAKASITKVPYISIRLRFSLEEIYEVLKSVNFEKSQKEKDSETGAGLYFTNMNIELYSSISKLVQLLNKDDKDIEFLQSFYIKEVLYNILKSDASEFVTKFLSEDTISHKIAKIIKHIKDNFNEKLNMKSLARSIQMSESSLYQHFKSITRLSPLQFQKQLRLQEAMQLLSLQNMQVQDVAYEVGYDSPSQFTREFTRMFGSSPKSVLSPHAKNLVFQGEDVSVSAIS